MSADPEVWIVERQLYPGVWVVFTDRWYRSEDLANDAVERARVLMGRNSAPLRARRLDEQAPR